MVPVTEDGHVRYKQCVCLKQQIKEDRLEFAKIPDEFKDLTINSFDTSLYKTADSRHLAQVAKKMCANYIKNFEQLQEQGKGLYLHSSVKGSGKTRMAVSIANALINHCNVAARIMNTLSLLDEIKKTYDPKSETKENQIIEEIQRIDVLILDDIGIEKAGGWVDEKFYQILNSRMQENKVTMFTSNCRQEELKLDERVKNRIGKMAVPIQFPEESVRTALAQKENVDIQKMLLG